MMDYNKKGVKWYWIALFLIYSAGVVTAVLWSNRFLYSQTEFQKALIGRKSDHPPTIQVSTSDASPISEPSKQSEFLWGKTRTAVDPTEVTRNRRFAEESSAQIQLPEGFTPTDWFSDPKGVLFIDKKGEIAAMDWEGFLVWRFKPHQEMSFFQPVLLENQVLLTSRSGHIYSLNRQNGEIRWFSALAEEIFSSPILIKDSLYVVLRPFTREIKPVKDEFEDDTSPGIAELNPRNGDWLRISKPLPIEKESRWSSNDDSSLYIAQDKTLLQIDLSDLTVKRSKSFEAAILSPVMLLEKSIIVPTRDGRVFGLNYSFTVNFESDLGHSLSSAPTFVPIWERVAVVTENGYLHVIDAESGDRRWRFNLQNESLSNVGWSSRLNGKHIEELNLGWRYKGWSVWTPCVKDRVCIYNPDEGQIIGRIILTGAYTGLPYIDDKTLWFVLKKDDQWKISKFVERNLLN